MVIHLPQNVGVLAFVATKRGCPGIPAKFPFLGEHFPGQSGFHAEDLLISFLDLKEKKILLQFHPSPDPSRADTIFEFEKQFTAHIHSGSLIGGW